MTTTNEKIDANADDAMYGIGVCSWHSSDGESGPDMGLSVGLGGWMLLAGEVPGLPGWTLAIYPKTGDRVDIASDVDRDAARDLIEAISGVVRNAACTSTAATSEGTEQ